MLRPHLAGILLLAALCSYAQQPVAPTPEVVGPVRGDNWSGYNIVNSFETGYRWVDLSGSSTKFRSDENLGNGIRLLSGFFSLNSKNGHGALFDQLVVTTGGLGGDPSQNARLTVQKNRLYQYDFYWRQNNYFNPGLTTDGGQGQHLLDTSYALQDHDLTLFPKSPVKLFFGYSRSSQSGAGISTVQLFSPAGPFDSTGGIFPIFTNIKVSQNDYRIGGEGRWHGLTVNLTRGWEDFKDDTLFGLASTTGAAPLESAASLSSFLRSSPYHGVSPYWKAAFFRAAHWLNLNGRFTYTRGNRAFLANETAIGTNQFGALANQQIVTAGNARRPVTTGNLDATILATAKLNVSSRTSFYDVKTEGNSAYLQYDNATQSSDLLYFQYLGIRTINTDIDALYQVRPWLDAHAGYAFSDRKITSTSQFALSGTSDPLYEQTNRLHSGVFGFRLKPLKGLTVSFDGEEGRADRPFTPKSEANYNTFSGSFHYNVKHLRLSAMTHTDYNLNSVTLSAYSSHARTYSGSASWVVGSWLSLDATYTKLHLDTLGGIAFFSGAQFQTNQLSAYISNIHSGTLSARLTHKRLDLYLCYSHVQDVGDGRNAVTDTVVGPSLIPFQTAQTFPLTFLSPMGRLSVRVSERVRWNVGYQYYGYHEVFMRGENYLAHTGYTSVMWSF